MYFSNYSQTSRFLAAPHQQPTQPTAAPAATTTAPRSSSKLFSTSVSAVERSKSTDSTSHSSSSATGVVGVHPLRNTYVRSLTRVADVSCSDLSFLTVGSFGSDNNAHRVIKLLVMKRE
ncbi:hypothetical protein K443DRAFT_498289 [Laccaria amethystina LaAM-08-1]|uniref:Uncharacterized protein n=1 Tax=Laccaria amethystina LaAM-08-1 TaxID=1095629 RepID=A0A0C9YEV9_9AGAR|nr:hypothetical protein K443DRAFT_498289 [Laccaria amethystina LaAM-08-1]